MLPTNLILSLISVDPKALAVPSQHLALAYRSLLEGTTSTTASISTFRAVFFVLGIVFLILVSVWINLFPIYLNIAIIKF